jgi:aquaporin TIP
MSELQSLRELPDGIGNMSSLTLFEVSTGGLHIDCQLELSISSHLGLQERIEHHVHNVQEEDYGWCSSIVRLGKLTCQCLEIYGLDLVKRPEDAKIAKLRDIPDLRELILRWRDNTEDSRHAKVLGNLVPPRTLKGFELHGYMTRNFPNWMVDISSYLPYLTSIHLVGLKSCDFIPPLGRLPNLRLLSMWNIPNVKKIGKEFYGAEGTCKKLRIILLKGLSNLDEWWTTRSGAEDNEFLIPNLHHLDVHFCPKLKFLPCPPKSMYWSLGISDEVLPIHGFGRLSSSTLPFHAQILSRDFSHDKWGRLQHLTTLEELRVIGGSSSFSTFRWGWHCR